MAGKNNRKHGRNKKKPACVRYTSEKRWETNSKKAVLRHRKRMHKKAAHKAAWELRKDEVVA